MKTMRFACLLMVVILILPVAVFANEEYHEYEPEPVTISYSRAVELTIDNSAIPDMDEIIEEMLELRDEMRDDLRRLERGDWTTEALNSLFEELIELEMNLFHAHTNHLQLQDTIGLSIQSVIDGMANPEDAGDMLGITLQSAILSIMATQNMGGNMAMMQHRVNTIFEEISRVQEGEQLRAMTDAARRGLRELDDQMYVLRIQQQQSKLGIENTLRSLMIVVVELEATIKTMEANLALSEENLRRVTVRHSFGLASSNELRTVRQALNIEQMNLLLRKTNLYNARNSLNLLLGQPLAQHTIIEYERELPEIPEDLDAHINEIIPQTPTIRLLQMDVDREYEAMRAYRGTDRETRAALREAYERATQRRDQSMLTMEAALRRAYNDLLNLQTQKETQLLQVYRAQQALEIAETNLTLGRVTRHEITQAQLAIFQAEQAIESTLNQKWTLAFRLQNPTLLQ